MNPLILNRIQAAKYLGVHPETLGNWVKSGKATRMAGTLPGSPVKFLLADLEKIKESMKDKK